MKIYYEEDKMIIKSLKTDRETYFYLPKEFNKHQVNLSGGTDSAAVLYYLTLYLKYFNRTNEEIHIITGMDTRAPNTLWHANEIYLAIHETAPEIPMTQYTFEYTKKWKPNGKEKITKTDLFRPVEKEYRTKHGIKSITYGRTANPPIEVQKELGFYGSGEKIREEDYDKPPNHEEIRNKKGRLVFYRQVPWEFLDKSFIAELYHHTPFLKETIFPITASCISKDPIETNFFSKPCKNCYWCYEKHWAFGTYDGGEI